MLIATNFAQLFVPTEIATDNPLNFNIANNYMQAVQANVCNATLYDHCMVNASINLPYTMWSVPSGLYVQFAVYAGQNCQRIVCTNNYNSPINPASCQFVFNAAYGPQLSVALTSGKGTEVVGTFNIRFDCSVKYPYTPVTDNNGCPSNMQNTRKIYTIDTLQSIPTSPYWPQWGHYSFAVCPNTANYAQIDYSAVVTDLKSAISSYFCNVYPCQANNPLASDTSGSGINIVTIGNLNNQMVYFDVAGWGVYSGTNNFRFSISVVDQQ